MANEIDFDELSRRAMTPGAPLADFCELYGQVFALPAWLFLARGQFPDVHPYVASNAAVADGQDMVRAFTDDERLARFVQENGLESSEGGHLTLSLSTDTIIEYLEQLIPEGIYGIWFNSDSESDGFFAPLAQLRPIREYLEKEGWKAG